MIGPKKVFWVFIVRFLLCLVIAESVPSGQDLVPSLTFDDHSKVKRAPNGPTSQSTKLQEMVFLSQPQGVQLAQLNNIYSYDKSAGSGATIYMCDSGADPNNAEFANIKTSWRWAGPNWATPDNPGTEQGDDNTEGSHGTEVLSKIAGLTYGIARNANIVVVRTSASSDDIADEVNMLKWIINDWKSIRDQASVKVAIINMSFGYDVNPDTFMAGQEAEDFNNWRDAFNEAISEGLLPILPSGNDNGDDDEDGNVIQSVTAYPALFAGLHDWNTGNNDLTAPAVPQMLVVAATDNKGAYWFSSQVSDFVKIAAPGVGVTVATNGGRPNQVDGTSLATGSVSGLAAYLTALPTFDTTIRWTDSTSWTQRVSDLYNFLLETASYPRQKGNEHYPNAIYNLDCGPSSSTSSRKRSPSFEKRDAVPNCQILPLSIVPSSSSQSSATSSTAASLSMSTQSSPVSASTVPTSSPTGIVGKTKTSAQLGYNPVNYGDLYFNGMVKAVSSILLSPCSDTPSGTAAHCSEATQTIAPVAYVEPQNGELSGGDLSFVIKDSKYTSNAQRNGMIDVAANALYNALDWNAATPSASKNCINKKWEKGCNSSGKKRSMRMKREVGSGGSTSNGGSVEPETDCTHGEQVICTGPDNILVVVIDQSGTLVANLDVDISFEQPGDAFGCMLIEEIVDGAVAVLPEGWAAEPEVATVMGQIEACCQNSNDCNVDSLINNFIGGGGS